MPGMEPTASQIVLASGSTIRRCLLEQAGLAVRVHPARIDEDAVKQGLRAEGAAPRDVADMLAEMKALRVSGQMPGSLVVAADQVLALGREIMDKPPNMAMARMQLERLRGRGHKLLSAVVIARDGQVLWRHVGTARLWMRDFSDDFLDGYLQAVGDEVLTTVGGYQLEGLGVRLFSRIEGDYFTILGLPLLEVLQFLVETGELPA